MEKLLFKPQDDIHRGTAITYLLLIAFVEISMLELIQYKQCKTILKLIQYNIKINQNNIKINKIKKY